MSPFQGLQGALAALPSPEQGVWNLGPLPLRAYALWIMAGIVVAVWMGERRWRARGGRPGAVLDIAAWVVPFGIVGGRIYHVLTSWESYFGLDGDPVEALMIWRGGLGIWGAVALGVVGGWIGCRRAGILTPAMADAVAPGIIVAQAIGRLGNWFNNELYGRATDLPWGLRIHEWDSEAGRAILGTDGEPVLKGVYHPTFLYELLWNLAVAAVLIAVDRRFRLGHGRVFALYVLLYTIGRGWIETLRIDPSNTVLGLRLNVWTSIVVGLGALVYLVVSARRRPGRETQVYRDGAGDVAGDGDAAAQGDGGADDPEREFRRPDADPAVTPEPTDGNSVDGNPVDGNPVDAEPRPVDAEPRPADAGPEPADAAERPAAGADRTLSDR